MSGLLLVRATVRLPPEEPGKAGPKPGDEMLVDPTRPFIADCLEAEYLVPLPPALQPSEKETPDA